MLELHDQYMYPLSWLRTCHWPTTSACSAAKHSFWVPFFFWKKKRLESSGPLRDQTSPSLVQTWHKSHNKLEQRSHRSLECSLLGEVKQANRDRCCSFSLCLEFWPCPEQLGCACRTARVAFGFQTHTHTHNFPGESASIGYLGLVTKLYWQVNFPSAAYQPPTTALWCWPFYLPTTAPCALQTATERVLWNIKPTRTSTCGC